MSSGAHPRYPDPLIPLVPLASLDLTPADELVCPPIPLTVDGWSPLVLGCATFGWGIYAPQAVTKEELSLPLRTVRLAFKYGIRVVDTSPHYHPSEIVLGNCLRALRDEYPRNTYKVVTKCGQYSSDGFDYSPENIERSVRRSLDRLGCEYLDIVYLHDVEFIADKLPGLQKPNRPKEAFSYTQVAQSMGLAPEDQGKILGEGDAKVLKAFEVLGRLKEEGLIKEIGICGYPLPILLRLSYLIRAHSSYELTTILSYSHSNLANDAFSSYLPHFPSSVRLLTASPLNMGLLSSQGPPAWHPACSNPANAGLAEAARQAGKLAGELWSARGGAVDLALGFGLRNLNGLNGEKVPVLVGAKNQEEIHQAVRVWSEVNATGANTGNEGEGDGSRIEAERKVREVFIKTGWEDLSWESPGKK
ncbi:Predicted oxidoreductase [Phaffia rhodozyma]|uniref:Predicted oxidoreductase n=1 Tax=Phaffia rhodozyma TaxID=264483 RepID=A0A0F7SLG9_PHARH|nr:Predicted oxidoreductase [Phaffia rhodozyma]